MISADDVVSLTDGFDAAGIDYWIGGGWGIDALLGTQTRDHNDLDISVPADQEGLVLTTLEALGFTVSNDWRPVRVALRDAAEREVDVHPIRFRPDGSAWLPSMDGGRFEYPADCFTTGVISGRNVPCLSASQQVAFHRGYALQDKDRADLQALASAGLVETSEAEA